MITVHVVLTSARTGRSTELARMQITNTGEGTENFGVYDVKTFRGRSSEDLNKKRVQRTARISGFNRKSSHVWKLVAAAPAGTGHARNASKLVEREDDEAR